jgi:hypothetical protein
MVVVQRVRGCLFGKWGTVHKGLRGQSKKEQGWLVIGLPPLQQKDSKNAVVGAGVVYGIDQLILALPVGVVFCFCYLRGPKLARLSYSLRKNGTKTRA